MTKLSAIAGARLLIMAAMLALALAVWVVTATQRSAAETTFRQSESAELMLAGMLDQQTGARGFALTGKERFLAPYYEGQRFYSAALLEGYGASRGDRPLRRSIDELDRTAKHWQRLAVVQIAQIRRRGARSITNAQIDVRKRILDKFRRQNSRLRATLAVTRKEQLSRASTVAVAVVLTLSLAFGLVGHVLVQRATRLRRRRDEQSARERNEQAEFAEGMLIARDEREADRLLKRHLERVIVDSSVAVIANQTQDGGLQPMTPLRDGSPMLARIADAAPDDCMAIRLGRPHNDGPTSGGLLCCALCGQQSSHTFCVPSVVSSDVIGSVLVERDHPLDVRERARVRESVAHSGPVLANLRTVFSAELRATTDQLTGLPNKRAVEEQLHRMAAQAGRGKTSLAAIVVDIDHFKRVNDNYGHPIGDLLLSAIGAAIAATMRTSDFAGRYGGEEFVLLLPDTGVDGAMILAEKVRGEIERLRIMEIDDAVTASFGVAVLPDHASQGESLLREADRALYVAKGSGRNRVQTANEHHGSPNAPV